MEGMISWKLLGEGSCKKEEIVWAGSYRRTRVFSRSAYFYLAYRGISVCLLQVLVKYVWT